MHAMTAAVSSPSSPGYPHPGGSTAGRTNVEYRLAKLASYNLLKGVWLDCGCADGGYTNALVEWGVDKAVGVDPDEERVHQARLNSRSVAVEFHRCSTLLPFPDMSFDGVLLNEVLEHVEDEAATLREIKRVLKPAGHLVVMSPNRFFPFEGHGLRVAGVNLPFPVPLVPWLPKSWVLPLMAARNYWPHELKQLVVDAGLKIVDAGYVLPVFEVYPWIPKRLISAYRRMMPAIERTPLRRFGVSTLVVATRRPEPERTAR
ncbi:MAG: class I SAM-dependent methyltransferase [Alphaproteobacteria bacterium]|nr:class I SAM-dependent methyltransferase [Alphaproteobacteria bacterium]